MNNDREYIKKIKILFILGPYDTYFPELLAKKLNEIINGMDKDWKVFAFGIQSNHQDIISSKLKCPFKLCKLPTILPSKHKSGWMFSFSNLFGYILYLIACIWYGRKLVIKEKIHIIYMHNNFLQLNLTGYILSRLTKTRCIVRVSADFLIPLTFYLKSSNNVILKNKNIIKIISLIYRKLEIFIIKQVDWVITHSPEDFEKIKKMINRITFVPLSIDMKKFRYIADRSLVNNLKIKIVGKKDAKIILFVGRLHPEKEIGTLLRAFKIVSQTHDNILLLLIGTGDYLNKYKQIASKLKILNKTFFLGYIPHDKLPLYYNMSDLYVLPSIREAWSNSLMEAMACKIPSIVTEVGANPYLVIEGKTGFLVPLRNPIKLAEKIKFLLEHPVLAKKVSENAFKEISKYKSKRIDELHKFIIKNLLFN